MFAYESVEDVLHGLSGFSEEDRRDAGQMAACGHDPVDAVGGSPLISR
jgi:hypothetical protein